MLSNRKITTVLTHCIGWIVFLTLPVLFIVGQNDEQSVADIFSSSYYWLFLLCYALLFYTHTYVAFPRWYRRKTVLYALYILVFFCVVFFLKPFDRLVGLSRENGITGGRPFRERIDFPRNDFPMHERRPPPMGKGPRGRREMFHFDIISTMLFVLTLALSFAVIAAEQLRVTKERALLAETKKVEAELSFLKMQIHPHFLFNTLNNIYALATAQSENTPEAILKLSNILRYVVDDVSDKFVALTKEINCIRDYIALQQLRLGERTRVQFDGAGNFDDKSFAPMLLMTFVENAFKYGVSAHHHSTIDIRITARDSSIHFFCRNDVFPTSVPGESTGIGLTNARQRLEYLYGNGYKLDVEHTKSVFTVNLLVDQQNNLTANDA